MADEAFDKLYGSIKQGRLAEVQEFLDLGGDPNLTNRNGWNLLMSAAFKGNSKILCLLLEQGVRLEDVNVSGETALTLAAGGGYVKCVKLLLAHGASVNVHPSGCGLLAFMQHARHPSEEVNQLLAEAGAA